ncbi:Mov34/MPN/PAD-1 family protein [Chromobacterium haemolyticum]|uniref:Mov34/MPN/PAD-1 family protein n=1 Tax=Chromobacterium haemolyticum TaxID=394935 RepID=UPI0005BD47DE|nr:Mov34/MPN/PAD-1 family protein [Chromobacterium haemolyticum]
MLPDLAAGRLEHEESRRLLAACSQHPAFDVVELRRLESNGTSGQIHQIVDGIVVECCDGTVPSRNAAGVTNRERLLLLHGPGLLTPHEVRALRANFPATPHQNSVPDGEPPSLCLYFEPWSAVERTWTPAKHLQRILWWLRETALGTLHRNDQPLERLHFVSPYQIVLPADFKERAATQEEVLRLAWAGSRSNGTVLRGVFQSKGTANTQGNTGFDTLIVTAPTMVSMRIEPYPSTLGSLHDQLVRYGSELLSPLIDVAKNVLPNTGLSIQDRSAKHTFLLLQMPVARSENDAPERIDVSGFIIHDAPLAQLGVACGAYFDGKDGNVYENRDLGVAAIAAMPAESGEAWRHLRLEPVDVRIAFSLNDARRASGVSSEGAEFQGVLAGVGALGSCMAELWSREGWGSWSYIDEDILHAHNIVRHAGKDLHIGWAKVDVTRKMAELNWPTAPKPKAIAAKVNDFDNPEVNDALLTASLLVDATTTLEVPRDLSDRDSTPRMVSTFLTPPGRDCVLLLEDEERKVRLSSLEAQYYRAILNSDWGPTHLIGHQGSYWVGAGCRDLSGILSQEVVQLHGATLARQVRLLSARPEAQIRIWSMHEESGALAVDIVPVMASLQSRLGEWDVIWDEGLETKLRALREGGLPNETGGVVLGYVDQKRKAIQIVDVLPAPSDSDASRVGFTRGADGVKEAIERVSALTANVVSYLGEWHSHPRHSSAAPSAADAALLAYLAETLATDGVPALMVIVGETDISISLGEGTAV